MPTNLPTSPFAGVLAVAFVFSGAFVLVASLTLRIDRAAKARPPRVKSLPRGETEAGFFQRMATDSRVLGHQWAKLGETDLADMQERIAVTYQLMVEAAQTCDDPGSLTVDEARARFGSRLPDDWIEPGTTIEDCESGNRYLVTTSTVKPDPDEPSWPPNIARRKAGLPPLPSLRCSVCGTDSHKNIMWWKDTLCLRCGADAEAKKVEAANVTLRARNDALKGRLADEQRALDDVAEQYRKLLKAVNQKSDR